MSSSVTKDAKGARIVLMHFPETLLGSMIGIRQCVLDSSRSASRWDASPALSSVGATRHEETASGARTHRRHGGTPGERQRHPAL
jgi:hypothetical protein